MTDNRKPIQLENNLILRRAKREDTERLINHHAGILASDASGVERITGWITDLMTGKHPTFKEDDFVLVEDSKTGEIASSMCLISHVWSFAGIPFKAGQPELVSTKPEYRNRGLVRAQFELIHKMSAERGEIMTGITGIPYFYRLFGYEMTVGLLQGKSAFRENAPKLKEGETEPFVTRPAELGDIQYLLKLCERSSRRNLLASVIDEPSLSYDLFGRFKNSTVRKLAYIIEDLKGKTAGGIIFSGNPMFDSGFIQLFELEPGISWHLATPCVLRRVFAYYDNRDCANAKPALDVRFNLPLEHPANNLFNEQLPKVYSGYSWYIRIPDIAGFMNLIKPELSRRLAASPMAGWEGVYKISWYRGGLQLKINAGVVDQIEAWMPNPAENGDTGFPYQSFISLLTGYKSFKELTDFYPDAWAENDEMRALTDTLFPKLPSCIYSVV